MVIILTGATASGKSTIGRSLAAELGWAWIDADDRQAAARIRPGIPLTDADRAGWLPTLHAIIAHAVGRREHAVVACSAFTERQRQLLRGDLRPVRFVYLKAPESVLRERLRQLPARSADAALLPKQLSELEEPREALVIDAEWPPERILGAIRYEFGV